MSLTEVTGTDLCTQLEIVGKELAQAHIDLAIDRAAYQKRYWIEWDKAADEQYVSARSKRAEQGACLVYAQVLERSGTVRALTIRWETLRDLVAYRAR